jgi:hypothetical protein
MKKLLTLAVIISLLIGVVPFSKTLERRVAMAADQNTSAVHIAATFRQVGFDWNNTPLNPPRDFPWQKVGQSCWGRANYMMPNAKTSVSSAGLPIPETSVVKSPVPKYYTQVYLNVKPQGGVSQESNAYFVVFDSAGQVWYDKDGFFNDSRYNPTNDPIPPRWPFETYPNNGNYVPGSCSVNLKSLIDPISDNNTKGPYFFDKYSTLYQPNQYFWDYKKDEKSDATDRLWRIGWTDLVDYPFFGAIAPDGTPVSAEVTYNSVTGIGDWDYNLPLVPFYQTDATDINIRYYQEFHTELVTDTDYTPGKMGVNGAGERPPEAIYRLKTPIRVIVPALPPIGQVVQVGDMRLTAVSKKILNESKLYPEGTVVSLGDWDVGDVIIPFKSYEKYVDSSFTNKQFDPNEWIYKLPVDTALRVPGKNVSLVVPTQGAIRLTNVNTKKVEKLNSISLDLGSGLFAGDALMMVEVLQGGCKTDKYDISVLTDVYMGDYPSSTAAALRTSNGDIAISAQRIQKNTVLDPALDKDRYKVLPGTTFHNVKYEYREFGGLEIFLDNGVDNNIGANLSQDLLLAQDLSDNLKEERTGEQYIGARDYESTLDLGRRLSVIPDLYKFHDVNRPLTPPNDFIPEYGCGEAIYYLTDSTRTKVQAGDKRFTDVDIVIGNVRIKYNRNTIVAEGDSDVGLLIDPFYNLDTVSIPGKSVRHDPYKFYYPDYKSITPDLAMPFDFDPAYTQIYQDKNENYTVDLGDVRLSEVVIDYTTYYCGSIVTGGNNWFMESPMNMITLGMNGNYAYLDTEILPGDIGLNVSVDGQNERMDPATNNGLHSEHLRVEKTSTVTVSVDPPPKKGEKVYVTMHDPEANEFNVFRNQEWVYRPEYSKVDYNLKGKPMNWFGDGGSKSFTWEYELPFTFPFAGTYYNRVFVAEKGFLNFTSNYGLPENFRAADRRIMVYGDDLTVLPPTSLMNITTHPTFASQPIINKDKENIYISNTGDSVTFRWRAQTRYRTNYNPPGYIYSGTMVGSSAFGTYPALDGFYYALIDVQCTLFQDGTITFNYLKDCPDPTANTPWAVTESKFQNRVNNVNTNTWVIGAPIIGIAYGGADASNIIGYQSAYNGLKNLGMVDQYEIQRLRDYLPETWVVDLTPFNRPTTQRGILIGNFANTGVGQNFGPLYDDYDEWKPFEDVRVLTEENPTATFEYTPYRGTSRESGIPDWVEIKAFKEQGGGKIAPRDSTYTFIQNLNYSDPTVWDSKWTRPEYFRQPWGIFQKTKHFVYPPTEKLVPNELKNTYDCFGIARLEIDPAKIELIPDKACVNPLDERQPLITMQIKNADDPTDVNDPAGMLISSWRRTITPTGSNVQLDFGQTDTAWQIGPTIVNSPVGAFYLRIYPLHIELYQVGDIVYIPTSYGAPSYPEYRRIVRIIKNQPGTRYNNTIWFDMPLINAHGPGTQVVPNPIIGNYNVKGGGINYMFTSIGGNGQRYIVQVRDDGSYDVWRWYEPLVIGQVIGALDPHDLLYSWQTWLQYDRNTISTAVPYEIPCPPVYLQRAAFPVPASRPPIGLEDMDCSIGQSMNSICGDTTNFPKLGEYGINDRYGLFGNGADLHWNYPNNCAPTLSAYGAICTFGVPVLILPYKTPVTVENLYDDGGKCIIAAWPQDPVTPMNIRLYLNTAIFDYNSVYKHPPYFALDTGMGIDYCGEYSMKVATVNPGLNFTDVAIIDHALQNSKIDYTLGNGGLSKMPPPTPQIASRYNPMLSDFRRDLRAYPGGQNNTGRVQCNLSVPENPPGNHWNAYPAIWQDQYVKLGTEFMPMSDYGIAFYLKTVNPYDHYSFSAWGTQGITSIDVEGPFAFPKTVMEDNTRGSGVSADQYIFRLNAGYEYNEYKKIPVDYDFTGKLRIEGWNAQKYELFGGDTYLYGNAFMGFNMMTGTHDLKRITNPGFRYDSIIIPDNEINPWLYFGEKWFYWGVGRYNRGDIGANLFRQGYWMYNPLFILDELIATGAGPLNITVTTADGTKYTYKDCCKDPPLQNLPVHGIRISNAPRSLEIERDHSFELTLTEGTIPEQNTINCNSAFLIAWQDRGIINKATGILMGMGDGQLANPPRSSIWFKTSKQFPEGFDLNEDGKISFENYETEVLGSYDMATNTWSSGVVDGRTFMREDGVYKLDFSSTNRNQIVTMGYDLGGIPDASGVFDKKPDHVISQYELMPIYINAYKYGDDNTDRGFTPLWKPFAPNEYSHEVYLAGMTKMMPAPHEDLVISYGPDPMTAGVTPELVSADKPLTFNVLDDMGAPVDLAIGIPDKNNHTQILDRNIWNLLIMDPHKDNDYFYGDGGWAAEKAVLNQYTWVRTDFHNNDGTLYDNNSIYFSTMTPFNPIEIDFSKSPEGIYKFFGFCANDAGSFDVYVFTPDGRHFGKTTVSVKLPSISYKISNDEDPNEIEYEVPGSPDFVMTSMDKRIYTVSVAVQDAQGDPLRGTAGAQICEGTDDARITVTNTFLRNFNGNYRALNNPRYYNLIGVDKNANGKIEPTNRERINIDGFRGALYNTSNYIYSDGTFGVVPGYDIPPENTQYANWGVGCIYNSNYKGGYCFPDLNKDGILTFADSISLDQEGKASFKYYANDMGLTESFMGAFIGKNRLTTNPAWCDVAGYPGFDSLLSAYDIYRRFRWAGQRYNGLLFGLDWDAHPDVMVSIKGPDFRLLEGKTRQPMGKDLLDATYYDLIYGIENYFIVQAFQADSRDLPLKENGKVTFQGGRAEKAVYGVLKNGPDLIPETSIKITPAGSGRALGYITYVLMNGGYGEQSDIDVGLSQYSSFDVTTGIGVEVTPMGDLLPKRKITLQIRVLEAASRSKIASATVLVTGAGINEKSKTNEEGICSIDISPSEEGLIVITAEKEKMVKGFASLYIGKDKRPLFIDISPFPELTNQKMLHISGNTKVNAIVEINGKKLTASDQGTFAYEYELTEGKNTITTKVFFDEETQEQTRIVLLDTTPPVVTVENLGTQVDVREITLSGKMNEQGTVTANGKLATMIGNEWQLNLPVSYGKNSVEILVTDLAGNSSKIIREFYIYQKKLVELQIGNKLVYVNGVAQSTLSVAPYLKNGRTMLPIRIIVESLGAKVEYLAETKEILIRMDSKLCRMKIGSRDYLIGQTKSTVEVAPEAIQGVTFVPLRLITDAFGLEVEWIQATRTARIIKLS